MGFASVAAFSLTLMASQVEPYEGSDKFFQISISLVGGDTYLHGEDLFLLLRATNPHAEPLAYMSDRGFPSRLFVELRGSGLPDMGPSGWGRGTWTEHNVKRLAPDISLEAVYRLSSHKRFGILPPGSYRAVARVSQKQKEYGLATGEAVSNELQFRVVPWQPARTLTKRFTTKNLGEILFELIRTSDGDTLARWSYPKYPELMPLVRIGGELPLDDILWTVDRFVCLIAIPDYKGAKNEVIVIHRYTSAVETFHLRGGAGVVDRLDAFVYHKESARQPLPDGRGEEEETPRAEGRERMWLWACVSAGCGAAVSGLAVWLLTRRKRRAA